MNDVTQKLPNDDRWLLTALKSIGDGVIATDDRGRVLFLNPVAEALTGWPNGEAQGKELNEVFTIVNETTRRTVENPVAKVLAIGRIIGLANHTVLIARDGKEVPIDDSAAPILDNDGRIAGVILVFRDITEKRQAELQREWLAAIVESSDDIIASKTLDGVITSWNLGAERLLGYTAEEVVGRHVSMLMPLELVEDMPKILDQIRRGEQVDHYHTKRRRKDGTVIDISLSVAPIRDASGSIIGASKIGRDITQEKRIDAERIEADRRKDEFLATLAHELRNPLAPILNALQLMKLARDDAETLEEARSVMERQLKQMVRLIDDLLDLSRISRGKVRVNKERMELSTAIESAVEAVRPVIDSSSQKLAVALAPEPIYLDADPTRLAQVFSNLLANAAKYSEKGGHIWLTVERQGGEVTISVRDAGIGISAEHLPRLFEMFSQVAPALERSQGGLGIGLALAKGLTEMHGGFIEAHSEGLGMGSEFTVRLPIAAPPKLVKEPERPRESAAKCSTFRILVVDDNRDSADLLARYLRGKGHEVQTAYDGAEAVQAAEAFLPHLALLDIGLPKMSGYEAAEYIRHQAWGKDMMLAALTGWGQEEDKRRAFDAGFNHHMTKPVAPAAIEELLSSLDGQGPG